VGHNDHDGQLKTVGLSMKVGLKLRVDMEFPNLQLKSVIYFRLRVNF